MTFMVAAAIGAGGSLLSGLIGSRGASSAASTQANAATDAAKIQAAQADKALALQKQMYDQQVARNQPYVQSGSLAQNRLMSMLGLQADPRYAGTVPAPTPAYQAPVQNQLAPQQTRDQLRQQLIGQYTTAATPGSWTQGVGMDGIGAQFTPGTAGGVDEAGLNAEIERLYAAQAQEQQQQALAAAQQPQTAGTIPGTDPYYGKYAGDFSMKDFQEDPGYAFRLSEGLKGLNANAAARGGLISGGALKAATRYGQDMGSQEYQAAYNRYQTNRSNQLNPLGSLMSSGQNAANQMGAAGQSYGSNAGNLMVGSGNAMASGMNAAGQSIAAGQMGQANSLGNAINSGVSSYNQSTLLNALNRQTPQVASYGTLDGTYDYTPTANRIGMY